MLSGLIDAILPKSAGIYVDDVKINSHRTGLLLGSNLGDKKFNLKKAIELIGNSAGKVLKTSSIYKTAAWGKLDQPHFYNLAIVLATYLSPKQLLEEILKIESLMGRVRKEKWGPRIIDVDILFFDDKVENSQNLKIPHPELHKRKFALIPLSEIEPEWFHPFLKKNIETLIRECKDTLNVTVLK